MSKVRCEMEDVLEHSKLEGFAIFHITISVSIFIIKKTDSTRIGFYS